jgi:hypothetical protein
MRILVVIIPTLFVVSTVPAFGRVHTAVAVSGDNMCTVPHDDTAKWTPATLQALGLRVPSAYKFAGSGGGRASTYRAGNRYIGLVIGDQGISVPQTFYYSIAGGGGANGGGVRSLGGGMSTGGATYDHTMESTCTTVIAGRPAEITTWKWEKQAAAMTNGSDVGRHYLAVIRWAALGDLPSAYIWISSTYKSDLMSLRQIFWTAHFEGLDAGAAGAAASGSLAEPCRDTTPAPRGAVGDYVDTALTVMLLNGVSPPLARGGADVTVTFDSTGSPLKVAVGSSGMPDSDQARLGTIVGSNVQPQPPASVTLVRLHVGLGFSGTSIQLAGSAKCARAP